MGGAASGGDGLPNSSSRRRRSPRVTDSPAPPIGAPATSAKKYYAVKPTGWNITKTPKNNPQIVLQTQKKQALISEVRALTAAERELTKNIEKKNNEIKTDDTGSAAAA